MKAPKIHGHDLPVGKVLAATPLSRQKAVARSLHLLITRFNLAPATARKVLGI